MDTDTAQSGKANLPGGLLPLKIKCTDSDCGNNLHCFRKTSAMVKQNRVGTCRYCGISLVDWNRIKKRKVDDMSFTFDELRKELIRHHFWHVEIDEKALRHARRKGRTLLYEAIENRVRKYVGPANPNYDGRQTPFEGNIIFYGQHATATCCRKCIEEWHGVPQGKELEEKEIDYFSRLIKEYVSERLPNLPVDPEKVPPMRKEH